MNIHHVTLSGRLGLVLTLPLYEALPYSSPWLVIAQPAATSSVDRKEGVHPALSNPA